MRGRENLISKALQRTSGPNKNGLLNIGLLSFELTKTIPSPQTSRNPELVTNNVKNYLVQLAESSVRFEGLV